VGTGEGYGEAEVSLFAFFKASARWRRVINTTPQQLYFWK